MYRMFLYNCSFGSGWGVLRSLPGSSHGDTPFDLDVSFGRRQFLCKTVAPVSPTITPTLLSYICFTHRVLSLNYLPPTTKVSPRGTGRVPVPTQTDRRVWCPGRPSVGVTEGKQRVVRPYKYRRHGRRQVGKYLSHPHRVRGGCRVRRSRSLFSRTPGPYPQVRTLGS